jgi:hypothetical protein
MGRIMNWFVAVYNCVIAAWAEQSQFIFLGFRLKASIALFSRFPDHHDHL